MKLPAVVIAAAFAGGILLGLSHVVAPHAVMHPFLLEVGAVVCGLLTLSLFLTWRGFLWLAASTSLLCWIGLGMLAACLSKQPLAAEHILSRLAAQQVPLRTPLRWHGVLRGEPSRLPWGYSLDMNLASVEQVEGTLPVTGGMRLGYTPREDDAPLPELHAGDEITVFAEARLPLVYKDAGAFDRRAFLGRQDIYLLATLRTSKLLQKMGQPKPSLQWRVARFRGYLLDQLDAIFATAPEAAAILRAMLLGDRSFVDRAESVEYQKTGVFHVLVVAGLHVGALAVFLYWLARKLRLPRSAEALLILLALFAYIMVVEQRAPVLRAGLMAGIVMLGSVFYRRLDLLNSAALAALILLVANPNFVTDSGFLLSFLAIGCIAGIALPLLDRRVQPFVRAVEAWRDVTRDTNHPPRIVQFRLDFRDALTALTRPLSERPARWAQDFGAKATRTSLRVVELFLLSCVLQLGMLPLMARDFHRVSLLGPLVNLMVVPLTGVIVPLGFFSLVLGLLIHAAARLVAAPLALLVFLQHHIVSLLAAIPHSSYRIPGPPVWLMALFFLALVLAAIALRFEKTLPRWHWMPLIFFLTLAAGGIATYPFRPSLNANRLEVTVLDVGQGDSILVVSPKGSTLLIDGGGAFRGFRGREEHLGQDPGEEAVSSYLWSRGFQKLDAVALTHAHQDHIAGLSAVLENFHVDRLWLGRETAAPAFTRLKQVASALHVPIEQERRGQSFVWDGVKVDFLWPDASLDEVAPEAKNNDSLVVRLQYGDRTFLLPGDAEKQVEYTMLAENEPGFLHADVLKVGHHGSKNSSMPEFLDIVGPQISVISSGEENPYGHPSPELLERLEQRSSRILRTDQDGAVQILTDGHAVQVSCFRPCPTALAQSASAQ
ncbi:MAG TPA: DNA internalization-related competence protein ComEC/Rec2 [Candidatus Sulfotelmatobacter sp.]|nr:DNA internalization-related competence protein ComEC/Rec2 [Candidatus Sulfotelmatobacter sp.]